VYALTRCIEKRQMDMYAWNSSVICAVRDSLQSRSLICLEETLKRLKFALKWPRNKICSWKRDQEKKPRGFLHALQTECALCFYVCREVREMLQYTTTLCNTDSCMHYRLNEPGKNGVCLLQRRCMFTTKTCKTSPKCRTET